MHRRAVVDAFSVENTEHQRYIPRLMAAVHERVSAFSRDGIGPHVARYGAIPYHALRNTDHSYSGHVFDLYLGNYESPYASRSLRELEWAIIDTCKAPWWSSEPREEDTAFAISALQAMVRQYFGAVRAEGTAPAVDLLAEQLSSLTEYLAHIRMIEASNAIARLRSLSADFTFEPGRNHVRIVVRDACAADIIGRTFR
jgi:hypothetical protein